MSDNEIIKALECCTDHDALDNCDTCPLCDRGNCQDTLIKYCSNTINRQKAEIKNLKIEKEEMHKDLIAAEEYAWNLKREKAEVIKEFTERMKRCARFGRSAGDTELCYSVYCIEQMLAYVEKKMTKGEK